jgi:predicted DNA-binding protein (UPF0251 family)
MEDKPKDRIDEMNDLRKAGSEFVDILKQMKAAMKDVGKETGESAGQMDYYTKLGQDNVDLAKRLSVFSASDLKSKTKSAKFTETYKKALEGQTSLAREVDKLSKSQIKSDQTKAVLLNDQLQASRELTKEANKLLKSYRKIDNTVKFFDKADDFVKDIPLINKLFGDFGTAAKAGRDAVAETGSSMKGLGASLMSITSLIGKALFVTAVDGLNRFDEATQDVRKTFNITSNQAAKFNRDQIDALEGTLVTAREAREATFALSEALGTGAIASTKTAVVVSKMTTKLGLSADEAGNLYRMSALSEGSFKNQTNSMIGTLKAMDAGTKESIRYQDVMKDIGSMSKATLLTTNKFPGGVAKAAFQARKLGLSMSQLNSSAEGFLDFESSIAAEMEAELLLGKNLNLDKARAAALSGDQATLAAELAKNVGTAAEFTDMNVIQQSALAKAMGMSRDELAGTLLQQEALKKVAKETGIQDLAKLNTQQQIDALMKKGMSKEEALRELGKDELADKEASITAAKAMAIAQEKMGDTMASAMSKLSQDLTGEGNPFANITNVMQNLIKEVKLLVLLLAGVAIGPKLYKGISRASKGIKGLMKSSKGLSTVTKNAGKLSTKQIAAGFGGKAAKDALLKKGGGAAGKSLSKQAGKLGAKAVGKSLLKKIPILGALAGVGFAISRASQGDWLGAAGELASGVASTIPGLGTAASVAIDAGLAARDISQASSRSAGSMEVDDFTIKSNPKDTITMAGGTKLGGNVEALLEELISLVKSGGNVYLDGSKVGEALVLSSRLST